MLPLSLLYSFISSLKARLQKSHKVDVPVISVGNLTIGGGGKTPVTIALCKLLTTLGKKPAIVLRGYGRQSKDDFKVDVNKHKAAQVGDEALLLAQYADTYVSADKLKSCQQIKDADIIIQDDGLQNYSVQKDLSILVVDAKYAFGNNLLFPAGPMRESIKNAKNRIDLIILIGEADTIKKLQQIDKPVINAKNIIVN